MLGAVFDNIPTWNPGDPGHPLVFLTGVAIVVVVLGTAAILALRNPSYLRKKVLK